MVQTRRNELPEGAQIRGLLGQLNGNGNTKGKAKTGAKATPQARRPRPVRGVLFGATALAVALGRVNWTNDIEVARELATASLANSNGDLPILRGVLAVKKFMGLVNWSNAEQAPAWPVREGAGTPVGLQISVENFMGGVQWGD